MPKLWSETIDTHRRAVRDAVLDATAALVTERGIRSVTMSEIAERAGIGRATLYKYFPDVESILAQWHERHVRNHLGQLAEIARSDEAPVGRLRKVLAAYASTRHHAADMPALHRGEHIVRAHQHLVELVRDLLREAASNGDVRDDVPPAELAGYCLSALAAARELPSRAAVERLVEVTISGLGPGPPARAARGRRAP